MAAAGVTLTIGRTWRELRAALLATLAERPPFPETMLVTGSRLLGDSLRLDLLESGRAHLGLHVLTVRALVRRCLAASGPPLRALDAVAERELAVRCLPPGRARERAEASDHAPGLLAATLRRLRESGRPAPAGARSQIAVAWRRFEEELAPLAAAGWADSAGLFAAAAARAGTLTPMPVVLFGIERPGNLLVQLTASLARTRPVAWFVTARDAARLGGLEHATRREVPHGPDVFADRARVLFDRAAALPEPLPPSRLRVHSVQGARAELAQALAHALALFAAGTPLHRIGILARDLGPYAAIANACSQEEAVPIVTPAEERLHREPAAAAFLSLLDAALGGLERARVIEFVASPAAALPGVDPGALDLHTRRAGVARGLPAWERALAQWKHASSGAVQGLVTRIARSGAEVAAARGFGEAAAALRRMVDELLPGLPGSRGAAELLAELAVLAELDSQGVSFRGPEELRKLVSERVLERGLPQRSSAHDGVFVLGVRDAAGFSFDHVILLGLSDGVIPKPLARDAFVGAGEADELGLEDLEARHKATEQELLVSAVEAAGQGLVLSFQRSDEAGRERARSPWLRELARALAGSEETEALAGADDGSAPPPYLQRVAWDPARRVLDRVLAPGGSGSCPAALAAAHLGLATAQGGETPAASVATLLAAEERPLFRAGMAMIATIGDFDGKDLRFDACGLAVRLPEVLQARDVQDLGACPQRFLFRRVFRVEDLPPDPSSSMLAKLDLGNKVHEVLETAIGELMARGLIGPGKEPGPAAAEGGRILDLALRRAFTELSVLAGERIPLYFEIQRDVWSHALKAALAGDLREMQRSGFFPQRLEAALQGTIVFARKGRPELPLAVAGRLDRVDADGSGNVRVIDYKTGSLVRLADKKLMLRGEDLQLAIYSLLPAAAGLGPCLVTEARGVGPRHMTDPESQARGYEEVLLPKDGRLDPETAASVLETCHVVIEAARAGNFPFLVEPDQGCKCWLAPACRAGHLPSRARVQAHPDLRDLHAIKEKTARLLGLAP